MDFAATRLVPGHGRNEIRVASPEHLVAMKVLARRNDPEREYQELADLRFLPRLPDIDVAAVRQFFERLGLLDRHEELSRGR